MTTNRNQQGENQGERLGHETWEQGEGLVVLARGYMPDDSDPAWPSKSGQAD